MVPALVFSAVGTFPAVNWRGDSLTERYLVACVEHLEPNAIVLGHTDTYFSGSGWVASVRRIRPDVRFIDTSLLGLRWYYDRVLREVPDYPIPFAPRHVDPGRLGQALTSIAPTYLFPLLVEKARLSTEVRPEGFLYRVAPVDPSAAGLAVFESRLTADMEALGPDISDAVDASSVEIHRSIAQPWKELMSTYRRQGRMEKYEAASKVVAALLPNEPLHEEGEPGSAKAP